MSDLLEEEVLWAKLLEHLAAAHVATSRALEAAGEPKGTRSRAARAHKRLRDVRAALQPALAVAWRLSPDIVRTRASDDVAADIAAEGTS